jgi:DNA-binding NarL/FixJ family response regulator
MDINMPELNGIEATHQIMENCPSTRVVILSMFATQEHIFRALQAGARGYLLKESAGIEVVNAVREVMSGHRYLSQKISEDVIDDYVRLRDQTIDEDPLSRLSPREREVLQLVVEGKSSAEIAEGLFLSPKTVETYRSRLMQKLEIHDIPGLVKFAIQHGLTTLE